MQELDRKQKILSSINPGNATGVEIGALSSPIVEKSESSILYADHATTDDLREKYAEHGWDTNEIVSVDLALSESSLSEALNSKSVDYVIASHVIEHVPDLIGWLADIHSSLHDGGVLSLAIPDKRYCFDAKRPTSTVGEIIDAFSNKRTKPTIKQVYDFWSLYCQVTPSEVWNNKVDTALLQSSGSKLNAFNKCRAALDNNGYSDVHCWVFTPVSFLEMLIDLTELGLIFFKVDDFFTTHYNDLEFFVSLKKIETNEDSKLENIETIKNIIHDLQMSGNSDRETSSIGILRKLVAKVRVDLYMPILRKCRKQFERFTNTS